MVSVPNILRYLKKKKNIKSCDLLCFKLLNPVWVSAFSYEFRGQGQVFAVLHDGNTWKQIDGPIKKITGF